MNGIEENREEVRKKEGKEREKERKKEGKGGRMAGWPARPGRRRQRPEVAGGQGAAQTQGKMGVQL